MKRSELILVACGLVAMGAVLWLPFPPGLYRMALLLPGVVILLAGLIRINVRLGKPDTRGENYRPGWGD